MPVVLVVIALVAGCGGSSQATTPGGPAGSPAASDGTITIGSPGPSASPGITPLPPGGAPSDGTAWAKLELPALVEVARLEATEAGPGGVAPSTGFRLTSLDGTPVRQAAERLVVTPALQLAVAEVSGDTALLRPGAPLRQAEVYRFELRRTDRTTAAAWAVQAAWPLRVASAIPDHEGSDVPRDTGIEVTFDQPGVRLADFVDHFSIRPAVPGRFEQHDRTFVYVPSSPLARDTLYTVTVRHGLPLPGTGMTLERDEVIRFETTGSASPARMTTGGDLFDAGTRERAVITLYVEDEGDEEEGDAEVTRVAAKVHRLSGLTAALDAYRRIREAPAWTWRSSTTPVRTSGLPLVLRGTFPLRESSDGSSNMWFRLPKTLPAGWYVVTVTIDGVSRQALLQVTDLAAFTIVTRTRSLVWVNDLVSNKPIAGARVALAGSTLGRTDARGVAIGRTPAVLTREETEEGDDEPIVVVRSGGRTAFVPVIDFWCCGSTGAWWHLLALDRQAYRVTDTVNAWGVVRDRDSGRVPTRVDVELRASDDGGVDPVAPIAAETLSPDRSGAFLAHLSFADLPPGDYVVSVRVGREEVASSWLSIGPLSKPSWEVEVSTPRHAVLTGARVPMTAVARFFEGTPVAGADLRFTSDSEASAAEDEAGEEWVEPGRVVATDADGSATASVAVWLDPEDLTDQWSQEGLSVSANEPEEADISAGDSITVFRSSAVLDISTTLRDRKLAVRGSVHDVAFDRYDQPGVDPWDIDPRGAARAGAAVRVRVTEVIQTVRQTGTSYDFVAKRVVPVYETRERQVSLGTRTVRTDAQGTYRFTMAVHGGADRWYEVRASYADEQGRRIAAEDTARASGETEDEDDWVRLEAVERASEEEDEAHGYHIGETMEIRFEGGIAKPEVSRYLFAVTLRGLRDVAVQSGATFRAPFAASLAPAADIEGVRFTGTAYEVADPFMASLRTEDRRVEVRLTVDRDRYQPGGHVVVGVRTLDAEGRPVAASVFVYAVDEKLFAIGAAAVEDPLYALYEATDSGVIGRAWSHVVPVLDENCCDTMGGGGDDGGREDFRDWLFARLVATDAAGRGTVAFDLADDLTSWRVVASAVTPGMLVGQGDVRIPVGLPFFAEATVAPQYLAADRPVIRVRAYGSALSAGDAVTFRVSSDTLNMRTVKVEGVAFRPVEVTLPTLAVGTHRLRVEATSGSGAGRLTDTLTRTFEVVETRAIRSHTRSQALEAGTTVEVGTGPTTVTLVDAGRGRVVPLLRELASNEPSRADTALAAAIARDLLADRFGIPDDPGLPEPDLSAFQEDGGIALVPYASPDLELSAMAALGGDPRVDRDGLSGYFATDAEETDDEGNPVPMPVDREMYVLLGQAAIGDASLADVAAAAARPGVAPADRVTVALAALAAGDLPLARTIFRDLLTRFGERQGPWVRVNLGTAEKTAIATARLAIVAAALGDPLAADMDAEIAAHPPVDTLVDLERAIAASYWARTVPGSEAVAAVTLDRKRSEVTIGPEAPVVLTLTPAQVAGLRLDPVRGSVLVVSQWEGPVTAGDLTPPAGLSITRSVRPSGVIGPTSTVIVSFQVMLGVRAGDGCWRVTDVAPSGLAPVWGGPRWYEDEGEGEPDVETPWRVVGQRVDFCVARDPERPLQTLRYLARVVTPGTYRWEHAVLQSSIVPDQGVVLPAMDVTIAGLGS